MKCLCRVAVIHFQTQPYGRSLWIIPQTVESTASYLIILTHYDIVCFEQIRSVLIGDIVFGIERLLLSPSLHVHFTAVIVAVHVIVVEIVEAVKDTN